MASKKPHYEADQNTIDEIVTKGPPYIVVPKGLNIIWGKDDRYWRMPAGRDGHAELSQVCWLEVTCSIPVQPGKRYRVGFSVSLASDAFGWNGCPVFIMGKFGKTGKAIWKKVNLFGSPENSKLEIPNDLYIGDPSIKGHDDAMLYLGLYEVWTGKWKGGLRIHHAFVKEAEQ